MELRLRPAARDDVESAVSWLVQTAGLEVAASFIDAVEAAFTHVGRHPQAGSPRVGLELRIEGLRAWVVEGHPYVVVYIVRHDFVDVVRVLHTRRDLDAELSPPAAHL